MGITEQTMHLVSTGSGCFVLLKKTAGGCKCLKTADLKGIAEYTAEHHPLMYEEPDLTTNCCNECEVKKCFKHSSYTPVTQDELQTIIDLTYRIQEGGDDLIKEAICEEGGSLDY